MKIKNFESFINEELKPETYKSAADKLKEKGHKSRSERIERHSKEQVKNVKPVTLEMYGEEFTLDHNSLIDIDYSTGNKGFIIDFDTSKPMADWDDESISEEENERREMDRTIMIFEFLPDRKNPGKIINDISGLSIPDRKNARKVLMFLKDYFNYYGGPLKDLVDELTVNDIYEE